MVERYEGNPLSFIETYQQRFKTPTLPGLPRFNGGLVGYFGYETIGYIERRLASTLDKPHPLGTPDILLMLTEELAVVDNLSGKLYLIIYADSTQENAFDLAQERLATLRTKLRTPMDIPLSLPATRSEPSSEMGQQGYEAAVHTIKQYILDGDVMQVVPSQRMSMPLNTSPLALYRSLRSINPSPYMFFYNFDDFHVVGASPEILVRRENETITVRPIAGTRPRGKTPEQDAALAEELLSDPKEIAEHVMLIDLGRNDVGRVAKTGGVKLTDKMVIERYSHVMHIVSSVEGTIKEGTSNIDILKATFPAGTLSGSPKVRAMEIINEVEPTKRGVYGGAVGYLGFSGDMDMAIAIRTAVVKDNTLFIQSGGGIVADSDPYMEWMETQNKAKAVVRAAELAQSGLDA